MASSGRDKPARANVQVSLSVSSTLLVIGAVVAAIALANLFKAAQRPLAWVVAAGIVAWLLSWIISVLGRWMPRGFAILLTALGFVVFAGGGWVGVRATLRAEVVKLRTTLPSAAHDLELRHRVAATFHLAERTQSFVGSLDDRFGTRAQVAAAAGTASTYLVTGVLMLFLVGYGPRIVSAGLRQIADPERQAFMSSVVYEASNRARAYLLFSLVQAVVITAACTVVFYLLNLPAPFVLALLVGWLGAIPYLGIILGGLAPLLAAATEPDGFTYPVLIGLLVGLQLIEALVVRPRVDSATIRVGPTLVLVGYLVGFDLYGFGGASYGTAALIYLWAAYQAIPDRGQPLPS